MTWRVAGAARAIIGARTRQEDAFGIWPDSAKAEPRNKEGLLAVVTDGMGGHAGGEVAGRLACDVFLAECSKRVREGDVPADEVFTVASDASNAAIKARADEDAKLAGMGCTLVAAWLDEAGVRWVSVGDSLLLRVRGGKVRRLNADHSLGAYLDQRARRREISEFEAKRNPYRNALRAALNGKALDLVDQSKAPYRIEPGDWLVLASDGIATLAYDDIGSIVQAAGDAPAADVAERLIAAVREKADPAQDNTTLVVLKIERDPACADDAPRRSPEADDAPDEDATDDVPTTQPFMRAFGVSNEMSRRPFAWLALAMAVMFAVGWAVRAMLD